MWTTVAKLLLIFTWDFCFGFEFGFLVYGMVISTSMIPNSVYFSLSLARCILLFGSGHSYGAMAYVEPLSAVGASFILITSLTVREDTLAFHGQGGRKSLGCFYCDAMYNT
jgi:hypothetical protein